MTERKMLYGKSADTFQSMVEGMELVESGHLVGADSESTTINMSNYFILLLFCREITVSSGNGSGAQIYMLTKQFSSGSVYGTSNVYESSTGHVTVTKGTDDTVTIAPSGTGYDVYYALYAVM
ncbi:MAG: hypothetical protein K6F23_15040 [Solobacterium sp.]|nr:hypothetical protein [Solobacterium sp.]